MDNFIGGILKDILYHGNEKRNPSLVKWYGDGNPLYRIFHYDICLQQTKEKRNNQLGREMWNQRNTQPTKYF